MPGRIEFLDDGGGEGPNRQDEDQLEQVPPPRWPRWMIAVGVLVVAGAVVAGILLQGGGQPQAAHTTPSTLTATYSDRLEIGPPEPPMPSPGQIPGAAYDIALIVGDSDIQALASVDGGVVVLSRGSLARISDATGALRLGTENPIGLPLGDPSYATWELISDGHQLWTIAVDQANRVYRIDPDTLRLSSLIAPHGRIVGAAALDGRLYLDTETGVYGVAPSAHAAGTQPITRGGRAIAADPARQRLLLVDHDSAWSIRAYSLTQRTTVASAKLPVAVQSLTVVNGSIWVTGAENGTERLVRLDPKTLRVIAQSALRPPADQAPTLVAGGKDLWVRAGDQLWCVNANTGAVAQHWTSLPGAITSRTGQALVGNGNVVGRLRLNTACAG